MINSTYLYRGLCALARAHRAGSMAGHLGAAVVAGYFVCQDQPELDPRVYAGIEAQLDQIIAGEESIWYNQEKVGIVVPALFAAFPEEAPTPYGIATIADALAGNIDQTRQSGHNVIFTSIAIRALTDHPQYATAAIIDGICQLIASFNDAVPGRGYWGEEQGWIMGDQVPLDTTSALPPYDSLPTMADVVIDHLIHKGTEHRRGFGGLVHVVNHAAALAELSTYGFAELAHRGLPAHHHHLRLWRALPELSAELGVRQQPTQDPRTPAFWTDQTVPQSSAHLTHRIKTLYGFFKLLQLIGDPTKHAKANEQFLYLVA